MKPIYHKQFIWILRISHIDDISKTMLVHAVRSENKNPQKTAKQILANPIYSDSEFEILDVVTGEKLYNKQLCRRGFASKMLALSVFAKSFLGVNYVTKLHG